MSRRERRSTSEVESACQVLRAALRDTATVLPPWEAEEPILGAAVRHAIFAWLAEINAADDLAAVGCKPRSSALLFGPPGCGKTTLAHHLASRLGVPLVNVGAENLISKYVGESGRNVANLFDGLQAAGTRCVVFIDEIDAIGGKRLEDGQGATRERNSTLTVVLRRIEQFTGILVAATNRQDSLDPALWRRFGMQISVDLPDSDARFAILKRYLHPFEVSEDAMDELAALTSGAPPSLLRQLMEGIKRHLVLGPRLKQPIDDPVAVIRTVITSVAPAPEYEPPALWHDTARSLQTIKASHASGVLKWPPVRADRPTGGKTE